MTTHTSHVIMYRDAIIVLHIEDRVNVGNSKVRHLVGGRSPWRSEATASHVLRVGAR